MGTFRSCNECRFGLSYCHDGTDSLQHGSSETAPSTTSSEPQNVNKSPSWTLRRAATLKIQPETSIAEAPNVWASIKAIVFSSCEMNFLRVIRFINIIF